MSKEISKILALKSKSKNGKLNDLKQKLSVQQLITNLKEKEKESLVVKRHLVKREVPERLRN